MVAGALRLCSLALVALVVGGLASSAAAPQGGLVAAAEPSRAEPLGRARPRPPGLATAQVTVELARARFAIAVEPNQPVQALLHSIGIAPAPSDRVSVPLEAAVLPGMRIGVDRGVPLTLIDGGRPLPVRTQLQTARALIDELGISLGPLDQIDPPLDSPLAPDATVRIVRVTESQLAERSAVPYAVRRVADPSLEQGMERVLRPGEAGEVLRTVVARAVDGVEIERTVVSESEILAPVAEVRGVGSRPRAAPVAPAEIAGIVRAAADRWGADPDALLRVAWCESRYNPSAYNLSSGATGLFQFMPATFARNSVRAGYAGASIWDPVASANTAAYMFAIGQARQWACI